MMVYNTVASGDVTPGAYFNDGTKWVRAGDATTLPAIEEPNRMAGYEAIEAASGGGFRQAADEGAVTPPSRPLTQSQDRIAVGNLSAVEEIPETNNLVVNWFVSMEDQSGTTSDAGVLRHIYTKPASELPAGWYLVSGFLPTGCGYEIYLDDSIVCTDSEKPCVVSVGSTDDKSTHVRTLTFMANRSIDSHSAACKGNMTFTRIATF
jgi:hypothetical protein